MTILTVAALTLQEAARRRELLRELLETVGRAVQRGRREPQRLEHAGHVGGGERESRLHHGGPLLEPVVVHGAQHLDVHQRVPDLDVLAGPRQQVELVALLDAAGIDQTALVSSFDFAVNGFSAALTPAEAESLAAQKGVLSVQRDELRQLHTSESPGFLGLDDRGGAWDSGFTGAGVVVGVIDSGIWPEHPSFAARPDLGPPVISLEPIADLNPDPTVTVPSSGCDFGDTSIARFVLPQADGKAAAMYVTSPSGLSSPRINMCSASQPSSRAMFDAIRSAKHFLPSNALPP